MPRVSTCGRVISVKIRRNSDSFPRDNLPSRARADALENPHRQFCERIRHFKRTGNIAAPSNGLAHRDSGARPLFFAVIFDASALRPDSTVVQSNFPAKSSQRPFGSRDTCGRGLGKQRVQIFQAEA